MLDVQLLEIALKYHPAVTACAPGVTLQSDGDAVRERRAAVNMRRISL